MRARVAVFVLCMSLTAGGTRASENERRFVELDVFQLEFASDPQISPDGSQIVYVRNDMSILKDRKMSNLWIVNVDGTEHRKLTTGEGRESSPRWSPDGRKVAYVAGTETGSQIFLRWMDTGQTARLGQLPETPRSLSWSRDGKWIAFSMLVKEDEPKLVKPPAKPDGADWARAPGHHTSAP